MAYFSVAPTLCEITYDVEKDERVTPYRYQCWSANSRPSQGRSSPTFTETVNFSLPSGCSVSYYEYLRTLYDSRISSPTKGHHGSGTGPGHYSARSYYPTTTNTFPISSPIHENRPKTAAPYIHTSIHPSSLPSIHPSIYPSWGVGEGEEDGSGEGSRSADERLKWIDALNKWIPEQNQSRAGYLSFVGNAPMVEKLLRETLKKREALRKRNAELLEQRKQRKHVSSPLSERRQKVRFRTPSYSPKKPPALVERNLISIPKESWEGDKAESDSSSRLGGSSEQSSPRKQVEEDLQSQLKEEEEEEMLTKDLIEEEQDEKSEESLPSPSSLLPPVSMETVEKDAEEVEDEDSKKAKKVSSNKLTVAKVKASMQPPQKKVAKPKVAVKSSNRKLKTSKDEKDDVEDKDDKVEEGPAPIPMIGDTKTGPLSLVAGRESAKKTRVSVSEAQARRRQSIQTRVLNFEKKRAPKPPSPPPRPPTPPTPSPPPPPSREISIPDLPTDIGKRQVDIEEPPLPDPSLQSKPTSPNKGNKLLFSTPLKLQQKLKKAFKRDTSYEDELRRAELAEKRRQKQMELLEKMKNRQTKLGMETDFTDGIPNFDDYGFLAKYCIFNRANLEMYRHTFDVVDDEQKGWLPGLETMIALRGVNNRLTIEEEEYLYRILEMTGYNVSKGADFKLFSVMAALSHKISSVDDWMKILIDSMDFKMLEMKMFMCKTLWECNVDKETNRISLDQLCIELRAGGISQKHENEVREKLQHLQSLDLLDFLTYVPLFIMIHQSVVKNPLNNVRDK